jgi:Alginate lyase
LGISRSFLLFHLTQYLSCIRRTLALGRNLIGYVVAADLVGLQTLDSGLDTAFRAKLVELLGKDLSGRTLRSTHNDRPNNWGTHAGASRAAVAVYLQDWAEFESAWTVYKGFLGDRAAYNGFKFGSLVYQCDEQNPVGINPDGCTKPERVTGTQRDLGGFLTDDLRRGQDYCDGSNCVFGEVYWPPFYTDYCAESLQGLLGMSSSVSPVIGCSHDH